MDVDGYMVVKKRLRYSREPNEGYILPRSAEKGVPFVDFHAVLEDMRIINSLKDRKRIIKKIRRQKQ